MLRETIREIAKLLRTCNHPPVPNMKDDPRAGDMYFEGLARSQLIAGYPGSGKTSYSARQVVNYAKKYPDRGILLLDLSGGQKKKVDELILREPKEVADKLIKRLVIDIPGRDDWVIPQPEFTMEDGLSAEEQIQRVVSNLINLAPSLVENAPLLAGLGFRETAPQLFRLLFALRTERHDNFQITEARRLLENPKELRKAVGKLDASMERVRDYFLNNILSDQIKASEKELRTFALRSIFGVIESESLLARLGHVREGWTMKEVEKGHIVLVSGEKINTNEPLTHYVFTQYFSKFLSYVKQREADDPENKPIWLVVDELPSLLAIEGIAKEIGKISPYYRSRKVIITIIIQALWQLHKELRDQIWSIGNIVCFGIENVFEAEEFAQQLLHYDPQMAKFFAKTTTQNPTGEPDHGQYRQYANWIQSFRQQECLVRRWKNEFERDPFVYHVQQTARYSERPTSEPVREFTERHFKEQKRWDGLPRGVQVRDALDEIDRRVRILQESSQNGATQNTTSKPKPVNQVQRE